MFALRSIVLNIQQRMGNIKGTPDFELEEEMSAIGYAKALWKRYNPKRAYMYAVSTRRRQLLFVLLVAILIAVFYLSIIGYGAA